MFNPMNMLMMSQMMRGGTRLMNNISNMTPEQKAQMQAMGQNAVNSASQFANTGWNLFKKIIRAIFCGFIALILLIIILVQIYTGAKYATIPYVSVIVNILLMTGFIRKMIGKTFIPRMRKKNTLRIDTFPPQY